MDACLAAVEGVKAAVVVSGEDRVEECVGYPCLGREYGKRTHSARRENLRALDEFVYRLRDLKTIVLEYLGIGEEVCHLGAGKGEAVGIAVGEEDLDLLALDHFIKEAVCLKQGGHVLDGAVLGEGRDKIGAGEAENIGHVAGRGHRLERYAVVSGHGLDLNGDVGVLFLQLLDRVVDTLYVVLVGVTCVESKSDRFIRRSNVCRGSIRLGRLLGLRLRRLTAGAQRDDHCK